MRNLLKLILLIFLVSYSQFSLATGWTGKTKIKQMYSLNENWLLIKLDNYNNPTNCNVTSEAHILIDPTKQKTWFTLLTSAYMANKDVDFYIYGDCQKVHWSGPSFGRAGHIKVQ